MSFLLGFLLAANSQQMRQLNSFVSEMDRQPYYMAHEEVTSAISCLNNPPPYTNEQINYVLSAHGMGPTN